MLTCASVSVLILWASEEAAGVLMGVREEGVTLECMAYSPEGSLRAWLSVRGVGVGGQEAEVAHLISFPPWWQMYPLLPQSPCVPEVRIASQANDSRLGASYRTGS